MTDVRSEVLLVAKRHGFGAAQIKFSDKLEWIVDRKHGLVLSKAAFNRHTKTITLYVGAIAARFPRSKVKAQALAALDQCIKTIGNGQWDEEEHPRDSHGRFTFSGGDENDGPDESTGDGYGGGLVMPEETDEDEEQIEVDLHPETIDVGGDEWNRQTAVRLEREYQSVKSDLDGLLHMNIGEEVDTATEVDEDTLHDNAPVVPEEWGMLTDDQQESAKQAYIEYNKDSYIESEQNSYYENGQALDDAKRQIVDQFNDGDEFEWAEEVIKDWMEERAENGNRVPFDSTTVLDAIELSYEDGYEGNGDFGVEFDEDTLKPIGYNPDQLTLPGVETVNPSDSFTGEMRNELTVRLEKEFDRIADKKSGDMEVPEHYVDSALEFLEEDWEHNLDDDYKFNFVKNHTEIIEDAQKEYDDYYENNGGVSSGDPTALQIPDEFDPLQQQGGSDYKKTQALVRFLSIERGLDVLEARGLIPSGDKDSYRNDVRTIDAKLWEDWKSSSAGTFGGQILQLASHDELGARYREMPTHRTDLIKQADARYKEIGGFAGIKALVRAKWETSQYALDKAGIHTLSLYRGIKTDVPEDEPTEQVKTSNGETFTRFTSGYFSRNGAYSTSTTHVVPNKWNAGVGNTKVVLRFEAPRTAVISFPAYGINVHTEKEVVIAGTAFKNWDAWKDEAPTVNDVPIFGSKKKAA